MKRTHAAVAPRRLTARRIVDPPGFTALSPGSILSQRAISSSRSFRSSEDGIALGTGRTYDAIYAVLTANGGRTWKIASPPLFTATADGPDGVSTVGTAGRTVDFAYGPSDIDVTSDGGRVWYRVYVSGYVTAVVQGAYGIAAYVQELNSKGRVSGIYYQYVSTDHGRHWELSSALGG